MNIDDNFFMKLAIDEAWKYQFLTYPNPAVGCVIVKGESEVLAIEAHKEAGQSHAEILALKTAYLKYHHNDLLKLKHSSEDIHEYLIKNHNDFFSDCTIYTTLEPCNHSGKTPSCAKLLAILKPKKVVISQKDLSNKAKGGIETLMNAGIICKTDCLSKEGEELLLPFLKWSSKTFVFYKMAQTLNGSIDGGYISSNQALAYVHTLRHKIDLLFIGGNTVRVDKPTLDARFIAGDAPDVMIYSKNKIFDSNIPLFKVANRKVHITNSIFDILDYNFVMVEGGYNLLDKLKDKIDYVMLLVNAKMKDGLNSSNIDIKFKIVHENYIGEDKIMILKILH